jgi:hypothetical protein
MTFHHLIDSLKIDSMKFSRFIRAIQNGYNNIPYHNKTHATDVSQTSYHFFVQCDFMHKGSVSDLELTTMLFAAWCHDFEHP